MRIKQKIKQYRRDFTAEYECEHCGGRQQGSGYDDAFFHENVIPDMICGGCGKKSDGASSSPDISAEAVL